MRPLPAAGGPPPHTGRRTAGVCEDDDALRGVLRRALEREGLTVRATASGTEALRAFGPEPPDVLLLDVALPDADGRDLCQALRARGVTSPVLFLTAKDALPDRISGFHAGGDDYVTKPFALAELLVRVHALLRRAEANGATGGDPAGEGGVALDPVAHAVAAGDASARLTPTEFRLLAALAARRGAVLRRSELVAAAWPAGAIVHDNTLDAYIARIRRKLRALDAPDAVETVRGVGYVLR
jgi:two-component system OmpR family response regulator